MVKKKICPECKIPVEQTEVRKYPDHDEIVLKCGHNIKRFRRNIVENTAVSDSVSLHVISFETREKENEGFYQLLLNRIPIRSAGQHKYAIDKKGLELLDSKGLKYNEVSQT